MLVAAFFIIGASLAYAYQSALIPLLLNPLEGQKLVYLNPAGGFSFIFMISIYAGIAISASISDNLFTHIEFTYCATSKIITGFFQIL